MANIIIVGANQGIGYYIAERLLARGRSVAILDTSLDQAKALQASYPQRLLPVRADARDAASIQSGVAQTVTAFGSIDAAIHNACLCTFASEPDTGYDVYQDVLDVNFFGALRLAKAVLPYMRKAGICARPARAASFLPVPASVSQASSTYPLMPHPREPSRPWPNAWKSKISPTGSPFTCSTRP